VTIVSPYTLICSDPIKIECSDDASVILYGGDSLGLVRRKNQWLVNEGILKKGSKQNPLTTQELSILKCLPNGDLICNEFNSWDLILLDRNLNEKQRLSGSGAGDPDYYRLIKTRCADDEDHMIWLRGASEISIIDIEDFSARHIHNFWNFKGKHAFATAAALDNTGSKLVGIGFLDYPKEIQTIHVFDGGDGVSIFEAREIHSGVAAWICLEISIDSDVFFIGGAEKRDFSSGDAFLFALNLDENAETVNFSHYGEEYGLHCINSLRRHPEGNILFAGCHSYLAVMLWAEDSFYFVTKIKNVVENPITDIAFAQNSVYTVCDHDQGMALYFDDNLVHGREKVPRRSVSGNMTPRKSMTKIPTGNHIPARFKDSFKKFSAKHISLPNCKGIFEIF
jgi:hypothetical protein